MSENELSEKVKKIIDELKEKYKEGELTLQDIDEAVAKCSLIDPKAADNAVTVLYSGGEDKIAEALAASELNIRIINRTEAYELLNYKEVGYSFNKFVRQAIINENPGLCSNALDAEVNQKLYGTSKPGTGVSEVGEGYWSKISSQFASETKGDVYALVTDARADRIFRLEELKQALNVMADDKTINGCSKAELGKLSIDKIFETVKGKAIEDFADETVYVNEYGEKVGGTLTNKFLKEIFGQEKIEPIEEGNYVEVKTSDYLEAMHNKTMFIDKNGKCSGVSYEGTALEGVIPDKIPDSVQDLIKIKNSDYVEVEVKGGSGAVRNALRNSEIFIDEQGNIVGRSYKGTALEGHVSDVIPEDYVYSTTQGHFDAYASDAEMLARHGEVYENAQGAKRWIAKEWDYLQRVAQGEIVGDAYAESILRYVATTGKKLGELGKLDRIIIDVSDFVYNSKGIKFINKLMSTKVGGFVTGGLAVAGVIALSAVCTFKICDMISETNDALAKGDYGRAAQIAFGKTAEILVEFGGSTVVSNIMAAKCAAIGAMFAGPIGALIGGMVSYYFIFRIGEFMGKGTDILVEKIIGNGINALNNLYEEAMSLIRYVADPLVLDLDGDGFETLSVNDGVYFDEDATGLAEKTAWVSADDALLAVDLNGNGVIDDGSELLGTSTLLANGEKAKSGFEALAQYDTNGDGVIDCNDEIFSKILIWQDKNGDGISQKDELISLEKAGIVSISLETSEEDGRRVVIVTYADGSTRKLGEFDFEAQYYNTVEKDNIEISEEIQALPDVRAMGNVASLHSLMQRDATGTLKDYVQRFAKAASREEKEALVTDILYFITGATGVAEHSRGDEMDARKLMVVEKFMGRNFVGTQGENPVNTAAAVLTRIYNNIFQMYYCLLNSQTQLADYMNLLCITEEENGAKTMHMDMFYAFIDACRQSGADMSDIVGEMGRYIRFFDKSNSDDFQNYLQHYITDEIYFQSIVQASYKDRYEGTDGKDSYSADGSEMIFGNKGDDTFHGSEEDDVIYGGNGNDILYGNAGNDILIGGTGNDNLYGEYGNDTYYFNIGDGSDLIFDCEDGEIKKNDDRIVFGKGIRAEDVQMERVGYNLEIRYSEQDKVTIQDAYNYDDGRSQIESIVFADGTVWKDEEIGKRCNKRNGSDGDDVMQGYNHMSEYSADETFYAGNGDDKIYAYDGDDTIYGEAGNDIIYGGTGDDKITGGTGNDNLYGEYGNDTYYFNIGDGSDLIFDCEDGEIKENDDRIVFGKGIRAEDVQMEREGYNLEIRYSEQDKVTIQDAYNYDDGRSQIESIVFADGTVWKDEEIGKRCNKRNGSDGDDVMQGYNHMSEYSADETFYAGNGDDKIYAYDGDDTIYGEAGNDIIYGGTGDDKITGGTGNDNLYGEYGNDTYYFNIGDGSDLIFDCEDGEIKENDDRIVFGKGIRAEDVQMEREGYNLEIRYSEQDKVTIQDAYWYDDGRCQIESIVFDDNSVYKIDYENIRIQEKEQAEAEMLYEEIQSDEYVCADNMVIDAVAGDNMDMLASEMANLAIQEMSETTTGNVADTFNMANNSGNETDVQLWIEK